MEEWTRDTKRSRRHEGMCKLTEVKTKSELQRESRDSEMQYHTLELHDKKTLAAVRQRRFVVDKETSAESKDKTNEKHAKDSLAWKFDQSARADAESQILNKGQVALQVKGIREETLRDCEKTEKNNRNIIQKKVNTVGIRIRELRQKRLKITVSITELDEACQTQEKAAMDLLDEITNAPKTPIGETNAKLQTLHSAAEKCTQKRVVMSSKRNSLNSRINTSKNDIGALHALFGSIGCAWLTCPANQCPKCPHGMLERSTPVQDPVTKDCSCHCECYIGMPAIPKGMTCIKKKQTQPLGTTYACKADIEYRSCQCSSGKPVHGCFKGREIDVWCGCNSLHALDVFSVKQQQTAPFMCPPVKIATAAQVAFTDWFKVCKLGYDVEPLPCRPQHNVTLDINNNNQSNAHSTDSVNGTIVTQSPDTNSDEKQVEIRQLPADRLRKAKKMWEASKKEGAVAGFRWLEQHSVTHEHEIGEIEECAAVFTSGVAVCNKGAQVEIPCELPFSNAPLRIKLGCGCEGVLVEGKVLGYMPGVYSETCVEKMQEWSEKAKQKFLQLTEEVAPKCAAHAIKECTAIGRKQITLDRLKADVPRLRKEKAIIDLQGVVMNIKRQTDQVEKTANTLRKQMMNPVYDYATIPGFGLPGKVSQMVESNIECRKQCNHLGKCKGYSFNTATNACSFTSEGISYDYNYALHIKNTHAGGGLGTFTTVAGMKIGRDPDQQNGDSNNDDTSERDSLLDCKSQCLLAKTCLSFSYSASDQICIRSQTPVLIGSAWNYYERRDVDTREWEMKERHAMQNTATTDAVKAYTSTLPNLPQTASKEYTKEIQVPQR